jgi:hypothetical protein
MAPEKSHRARSIQRKPGRRKKKVLRFLQVTKAAIIENTILDVSRKLIQRKWKRTRLVLER